MSDRYIVDTGKLGHVSIIDTKDNIQYRGQWLQHEAGMCITFGSLPVPLWICKINYLELPSARAQIVCNYLNEKESKGTNK